MKLRARLTGHRRRPQDTWCAEPSRLDWIRLRGWQGPKHRRSRSTDTKDGFTMKVWSVKSSELNPGSLLPRDNPPTTEQSSSAAETQDSGSVTSGDSDTPGNADA